MSRTEMFRFATAQFLVVATAEQDYGYQYDGDDEDGETQAALDSGDYVAFDTTVTVTHVPSGAVLGRSDLGGSIYSAGEVETFFTAHRDSDPMSRNCTAMRAAQGDNVSICHYFPGMVTEAVQQAREALRNMPAVRAA